MEPIRVKETVEIGDRKFTVQELTVREIIDLISGSAFVSELSNSDTEEESTPQVDWSLIKEFSGISGDLESILKLSCENFEMKDLVELTPSSIRKIVEAFKKVNSDFLSSLKALGVAEALVEIRDAALSSFSKRLVTLSKLAT